MDFEDLENYLDGKNILAAGMVSTAAGAVNHSLLGGPDAGSSAYGAGTQAIYQSAGEPLDPVSIGLFALGAAGVAYGTYSMSQGNNVYPDNVE